MIPLVCAYGQNAALHTNLDTYRNLATQIASSVAKGSDLQDPKRIQLSVFPKEKAWYVEGAIVEGLKNEGLTVGGDSLAAYTMEVGISRALVIYSNIRREGLLGSKRVDRSVELALTTKIAGRVTGAIIQSGDIVRIARDTIEVSEIPRIENPLLPITMAAVPNEGFFSSIVEPLILLGSIAVAVLLLFNVRS